MKIDNLRRKFNRHNTRAFLRFDDRIEDDDQALAGDLNLNETYKLSVSVSQTCSSQLRRSTLTITSNIDRSWFNCL